MRVVVWSHYKNKTWMGEVPRMSNSDLFRYFNRVDDADVKRLDGMKYTLPSLSAGDTITYDGKTRLVMSVGFRELTNYENEVLHERAAAGEISMFDPALHRIFIKTNDYDDECRVEEQTNDDNDDGYPDGEWVTWDTDFNSVHKAHLHAGVCRVGVSGVIVTVIHNGEEIRDEHVS